MHDCVQNIDISYIGAATQLTHQWSFQIVVTSRLLIGDT